METARTNSRTGEFTAGTAGGVGRTFPFFRLIGYYLALIAIATLLVWLVPGFRQTIVAPIVATGQAEQLMDARHVAAESPLPWTGVLGRSIVAIIAMIWALAVSLPVAWALKHTRQLRYDPSLVQALIILPIVVCGVVLVVKNSLALAFSLAGIVAGVRFRQKLDQPEEAVYVLLSLGIGLAAGVQAIDIALAMSLVFTLVVVTMWRFDIGDIFAGGKGAALAIGDPRLLRPSPMDARRESSELDEAVAAGMKPDGLLVIRSVNPEETRRGLEVILGRMAKQWRIGDAVKMRSGPARIEIAVELKDKADPADIIAEIEARLSGEVSAAEYIPYGGSNDVD